MGLSETIVAASIGAAATVCAAMFQLISAWRTHNGRVESRQKRGSTVKSIAAVIALMGVAAVGGYLFSEFRNQRTADDMHSMRDELNAKLQVLAVTTERLAAMRTTPNDGTTTQQLASIQSTRTTPASLPDSVESVVYAPACQSGVACAETVAQPIALCGTIPSNARARRFELYIKSVNAPDLVKADFEQDLGGARFSGPPAEFSQGADRKAVCVNFLHWSTQAHIATLVVHFGAPAEAGPSTDQQTFPSAVMATHASLPAAQTVTMAAPSATP